MTTWIDNNDYKWELQENVVTEQFRYNFPDGRASGEFETALEAEKAAERVVDAAYSAYGIILMPVIESRTIQVKTTNWEVKG